MSQPMQFGIVLPSYITSQDRLNWAKASLRSLGQTEMDGIGTKPILIAIPKGEASERLLREQRWQQFETRVIPQPRDIYSNDGCLAWGWDQLAAEPAITHMFMLADDWLYNPGWLIELRRLIERRPGAMAWWIYRSAYEEIHKTLKLDSKDVMVRSINGGGCLTREEWKAWGLDYHKVPREHGSLGNLSLDLLHPEQRPGERWVSKRSYLINIGLQGVCQRPETPDYAVDFVGMNTQPKREADL